MQICKILRTQRWVRKILEFPALRVALQESQTLETDIARLRLARIDLLVLYYRGGRWASIYARRLNENVWHAAVRRSSSA